MITENIDETVLVESIGTTEAEVISFVNNSKQTDAVSIIRGCSC